MGEDREWGSVLACHAPRTTAGAPAAERTARTGRATLAVAAIGGALAGAAAGPGDEAAAGPGDEAAAGAGHATSTREVLPPGGRPVQALLRAWLEPDRPPDRCIIVAGPVRTAAAIAEALLVESHPPLAQLILRSGDPATDSLLADTAPALIALLQDLTVRQRQVGRLLLVDGLRRAEIAQRLGITRPTVSVMVDRARLVEIGRLAAAIDAIFEAGSRWAAGAEPAPNGVVGSGAVASPVPGPDAAQHGASA